MDSNAKALSGISYLSIFFLPFVLPIIVYFATNDVEAKNHAKRAFISQILTIVLSVILILITFLTFFNMQDNTLNTSFMVLLFISFILIIGAFVVILIWSIIQAVKVIR